MNIKNVNRKIFTFNMPERLLFINEIVISSDKDIVDNKIMKEVIKIKLNWFILKKIRDNFS